MSKATHSRNWKGPDPGGGGGWERKRKGRDKRVDETEVQAERVRMTSGVFTWGRKTPVERRAAPGRRGLAAMQGYTHKARLCTDCAIVIAHHLSTT